MKQILLLVAVYALIINQSSKSGTAKKDTPSKPVRENIDRQLQANSGQRPVNPDFISPVFSYTTLRFLTGYPTFTKRKPAGWLQER